MLLSDARLVFSQSRFNHPWLQNRDRQWYAIFPKRRAAFRCAIPKLAMTKSRKSWTGVQLSKWQHPIQIRDIVMRLGSDFGADLPGPRQTRPGGRENQRLIGVSEAGNRRGWTHTWLRSNQPQAVVLTPSDVPPPSHFFYPALSLFPRRPSFKDPHHLDVVTFSRVPDFPTIPLLRGFPLVSPEISRPRENQPFPKHFHPSPPQNEGGGKT